MKFLAWPSGRVQRVLVSTQKTIMELTWLGFFSFERACLFGFKSAPPRLPWSIAAVFVLSPSPARSSRVIGWRTLTESWCFALLGSGLAQMFGQMVSLGVKTLSNANLGASKHVKRKKARLPVDVRPSKTPSLQPPTLSFLFFLSSSEISAVLS